MLREPDAHAHYAVEAEMQVSQIPGGGMGFGLVARAGPDGAYRAGYRQGNDLSGNQRLYVSDYHNDYSFGPGVNADVQGYSDVAEWHTYRIETDGTSVRLLLDGRLVAEITDTQFREGGQVGLWAIGSQLSVRSFKVISL